MGLRQKKNTLLTALAFRLQAKLISQEQHDLFEAMFRRCRSPAEQEQVRQVIENQIDGWKTDTDRFSRILREDEGDDDDDPPALREALARARVKV